MAMNPFQGDDEDPFSGVRDEEGAIKREAPKKAEKKKDRVVTKEEMKKAGFDNLRDFLNAERGLKRRKDKPAEKGPDKATLDRIARKQREEDKGPSETEVKRMIKKYDEPSKKLGTFGAMGKNPAPANPSKYKKGGMVKAKGKGAGRADGCVTKGRTKGRMV